MSKIYLNTPSETLTRAALLRITQMTITWCRKNLGINQRKSLLPTFYLSATDTTGLLCGDYDDIDNEICIYYKNVRDVRELVGTVIHEWTHQLQPCRSKYNKWKGSYNKHPLEVEAFQAEALWTSPCWKDIKRKVNRTKK